MKTNFTFLILLLYAMVFSSCSQAEKTKSMNNAEVDVKRILELIPIGIEEDTLEVHWHPKVTNTQKDVIYDIIHRLILVEGGTFTMGCNDCESYMGPAHEVTVNTFYIYKFEIMQRYWYELQQLDPTKFSRQDHPVVNVSWNDCQQFIQCLNDLTSLSFRLPTEAEWEFAARGGNLSKNYLYSGSDSIKKVGWFVDNSFNQTHSITTMSPNELGIYNMSGNVWEWCLDWYAPYTAELQVNPTGPENGSAKVYRGGSYMDVASYLRIENRNSGIPDYKMNNLGFRIVLEK